MKSCIIKTFYPFQWRYLPKSNGQYVWWSHGGSSCKKAKTCLILSYADLKETVARFSPQRFEPARVQFWVVHFRCPDPYHQSSRFGSCPYFKELPWCNQNPYHNHSKNILAKTSFPKSQQHCIGSYRNKQEIMKLARKAQIPPLH